MLRLLRPLLLTGLASALWAQAPGSFVLLASTIGPIDSGIVAELESAFEAETGIRVRHVGAGTGAALDLAKQGSVDLLMVHAPSLEQAFVKEGFGLRRVPLMYNDFVILGPAADPAGIKGMKSAAEALRAIAKAQAPFLTRGDRSGTHVAELELWAKAGLKPEGSWYQVFEQGASGNAPTLRAAQARNTYTLMDRATVLALGKELTLPILVEGDEALLNHISLIPVNPARFPRIDAASAQAFIAWLTHPDKGQKLIREFGKARYGAPLFFPEARPEVP